MIDEDLPFINILLCDDDDDDRFFFKDVLLEVNYKLNVKTVNDADQLLKELSNPQRKPDLLFLDLNMPRKNGKECLITIRQNNLWKDLPIIIYSTSATLGDIEETFTIGANLYIQKASNFTALKQTISDVLSSGRNSLLNTDKEQYVIYAAD